MVMWRNISVDLIIFSGFLFCATSSQRSSDDSARPRYSSGKDASADDCAEQCKRCDGARDCPDGADELKCPCSRRLSAELLCDARIDCPDFSDELGCHGCGLNELKCGDKCVTWAAFCDGESCDSFSASLYCNRLNPTQSLPVDDFFAFRTSGYLYKHSNGRWIPVCGSVTEAMHRHIGSYCYELVGNREYEHRLEAVFSGPSNRWFRVESDDSAVDLSREASDCPGKMLSLVKCAPPTCQNSSMLPQNPPTAKPRIVGGIEASALLWSFHARILKNGKQHCGGSILNERWVLTASHCFVRISHIFFEVEIGSEKTGSFGPHVQRVLVTDVIRHPEFDPYTMQNDIALVRLAKPLQLHRWSRPTCLGDISKDLSKNVVCRVVGFGLLSEGGEFGKTLQEVSLPILDIEKCVEEFHFVDQKNAICAGDLSGIKDACQGDSGGPLMCPIRCSGDVCEDSFAWSQYGIVSYGRGCARKGVPGVYTKISFYSEWIENSINMFMVNQSRVSSILPQTVCPGLGCVHSHGICLRNASVCDGKVDCFDASDELGCVNSHSNQSKDESSNPGSVNNEDVNSDIYEDGSYDEYYYYEYSYPDIQNTSSTASPNVDLDVCPTNHFKCKSNKGCIPHSYLCDEVINCRDGSDEFGCSCLYRIFRNEPQNICDGFIDCRDLSDEFCELCGENMWFCELTYQCISARQRCDGTPDCRFGEDEQNCFALSPLEGEVVSNYKGDPIFNSEGYLWMLKSVEIHENRSDFPLSNDSAEVEHVWSPVCQDDIDGSIAQDVCQYLGFRYVSSMQHSHLQKFQNKTVIKNNKKHARAAFLPGLSLPSTPNIIPTTFNTSTKAASTPALKRLHNLGESRQKRTSCSQVKITCESKQCGRVNNLKYNDHFPSEPFVHSPWDVSLMINGMSLFSAALIGEQWAICIHCYNKIRKSERLSILGGSNRGVSGGSKYLSPEEVEIAVDGVVPLASLPDFALLYLRRSINNVPNLNFLCLDRDVDNAWEECMVSVAANDTLRRSFALRTSAECESGSVCIREEIPKELCNGAHSTIVWCREVSSLERGWRAVSWWNGRAGDACQDSPLTLPLLPTSLVDEIFSIMEEGQSALEGITPTPCSGHLCSLGVCISESEVCDASVHCADMSDEPLECSKLFKYCESSHDSTCECSNDEFKCNDGQCLDKSLICDGEVNCLDGEDEENCLCSTKLTDGEKRDCDGVTDCLDESDEMGCGCDPETEYRCFSSDNRCLPLNALCDGVADCENSEDENHCVALAPTIVPEENTLRIPSSHSTGYMVLRVQSTWFTYYSDFWDSGLSNILCDTLGFRYSDRTHNKELNISVLLHNMGNKIAETAPFVQLKKLIYISCV